jgi:hypothetical protein
MILLLGVAMTKFKVSLTQTHSVLLVYSDQFDTSDQGKWEELKECVKSSGSMDDDEFDSLPKKAPKNIQKWLRVYQCLDATDFPNQEENWISHSKGGFPVDYEITDENNQVVANS